MHMPTSAQSVLAHLFMLTNTTLTLTHGHTRAHGLRYFDQEVRQNHGRYVDAVEAATNSTVFVACVSNAYADDDACRMELQFAATTLGRPVVALVVEHRDPAPPWRWQRTWLGLLLAGELCASLHTCQRVPPCRRYHHLPATATPLPPTRRSTR